VVVSTCKMSLYLVTDQEGSIVALGYSPALPCAAVRNSPHSVSLRTIAAAPGGDNRRAVDSVLARRAQHFLLSIS